MIRNYFKSAWRNLLKNKFYAAISLIGLTIGLTVGILILIWVKDELSYNQYASDWNSIYRVNGSLKSGGKVQTWYTSPPPVAVFAKKDVPEVQTAIRVRKNYDYSLYSYNGSNFETENDVYTDPEFFKMFDVEFLQGDPDEPFSGNNSVILSASAAQKMFGNADPMGKTIQADFKENFTVVGIVKDLPKNSSIDFDMFFPTSIIAQSYDGTGYWKSMDTDWGNFIYTTYIKLTPNASATKVQHQLTAINRANDPNAKSNKAKEAYQLQKISEINLYSADGKPTEIQVVKIFTIVAILILIIASINYINLTTARAMKRSKEVSIRKIIGGSRKQLFLQFVVESILFFAIALILSCLLAYILIPYFNRFSGKSIQFDLGDIQMWKILILTVLCTLAASSIYPAALLSSFKPMEAIKGKLAHGMGSAGFRKILVTLQFVFSVALIIGTLIIGQQLDYIQSKDPGYNREQILTFGLRKEMHDHLETVKNELKREPEIKAVSFSDRPFLGTGNTTADTDWNGKEENTTFIVRQFGIDENFIPLMKIKFRAGHNFKGIATDSTRYILNETAVREMGIDNPIGKRFALHQVEGTIIGVVKDFNFNSMRRKVEPSVMYYDPKGYYLYAKTTGRGASNAVASMKKLWKQYSPGFPFNDSFLDEDYDKMYRSEQRTGLLFNIFSGIAIFVSCLGLFGLATFTAQLKTKEIGIRKVLGASVFRISYMLSADFLKLVLLAILIASPIAWYMMRNWLQSFAYRIDVPWWVFVIAGLLVMLVAILTVSLQAVKASLQNPTKSLRTE